MQQCPAMVELGLTVKAPAKGGSKPERSLRAQELAAKTIDKIGDPAADPEDAPTGAAASPRGRKSFARCASIGRRNSHAKGWRETNDALRSEDAHPGRMAYLDPSSKNGKIPQRERCHHRHGTEAPGTALV